MKQTLKLAAAILFTVAAGTAGAKDKLYCGEIKPTFGPFDYREPHAQELDLVEQAHYTEDVERGIKGNTGAIGGDLSYTLNVFPNHTRALSTIIMMSAPGRNPTIVGARLPSECYFERAVRFRPDDGSAWALYAQYLYKIGQGERAFPMLEKAVLLNPENAAINYNVGLALAKKKQYDKALPYAQKAYASDFPLPGLKQMLVSAGKWVEPPKVEKPVAAEPEAEKPAKAEETVK